MTPTGSTSPASTSGASASVAAVTWQPGVATMVASFRVLAMQLRQTEHRRRQQLRLIVGEPVPRRVQRGVFQPERSRQIDQAAHLAVQLWCQGQRGFVRQAEEHDVEPFGLRRVELGEHQVGVPGRQARVQPGGQGAGLAVAGGVDDLEFGVLRTQSEQFDARVPRGADDPNSFHDV